MNEEIPVDAGQLPFCFFILHSAFIICLFDPLQTDVGKTDRRHRAAQSHRATGGNGQRLESFFILHSAFCICFEQSQIIGRIHLNHFGVIVVFPCIVESVALIAMNQEPLKIPLALEELTYLFWKSKGGNLICSS